MELSLIAAVVSMVATFPQLYKTLKTGLLRDHNEYTFVISFVANLLLSIHGYLTKDIGIFVFGIWFMIYNGVLLWFKLL